MKTVSVYNGWCLYLEMPGLYDHNNREMHRPADGVSRKNVRSILISNIIMYIYDSDEIQNCRDSLVDCGLLSANNEHFDNLNEFRDYLDKYINIKNLDYRFAVGNIEFIVSNNKGYIAEWVQRHMDAYGYPGKYNEYGELMD